MTTWPLNVPVLTDGIVTLRAHTPADIDRMLQMAHDPEMIRWTAIPTPHSRSMSEQFAFEVLPQGWNEGALMAWAVEFEGRYAGNVDIRGKDPLVDIGYALHPDCRGHGVMAAAVRLAIDHSFVNAGKEVIKWNSRVGNIDSLRVAHACGFTVHGTQPDSLLERGKIHDAWTGSIRFGDAPYARSRWLESNIEIDGAVLRAPRGGDLERWADAENDRTTRHWSAEPVRDVKAFVPVLYRGALRAAMGERIVWTVADRGDDHFLGQVMVGGVKSTPEVGWYTHPDARGTGLTKAAVSAAAAYALDPDGLDLRRIEAFVAEGNDASLSVARSAGFTVYGRRTAAEPLGDGTFADLHCLELVR